MLSTWSVRKRLTLAASLVALVTTLGSAAIVTMLAHVVATEYITGQVAGAARRVAFNVERYAPDRLKPVTVTEQIDLIQVVDNTGKVRQASPKLAGEPPLVTTTPSTDDGRVDLVVPPGLITVGFRVRVDQTYWMSYAFAPTLPWYIHPAFAAVMLGGILLMVGVVTLLTSKVVGRALQPVKSIKTELAEITATDLGRRVPPSRHQDEIAELADTVNETLDRLQLAVEQQRRFASDASHDLRSPITAMRAQVEAALLHPRETDWEDTGRAMLASLDRLQAIVADLLTLASLDAGAPAASDPVDLARLVTEETARPRSKRVTTFLDEGVVVSGDRLRLARLLTNLLDNAERHAEGTVTVKVAREDGQAVLEVEDDGAGIAEDQREVVFRRFTRLDASRNRDAGGTGLGLPIAREIAKAHGGTLKIEDSKAGARFVLRLPL
ncbi:sensor histidine kinase [Nonomuraea sp. NPDC050556]|uniref:sensor histidine kinase n=1 Tax=Nonomuraea sp. NPDC050556 TaxID=3364369 RepID=UPI00378BE849